MEGEQFSLCWNNFHNNLSTGFNSLFKEEDLVDVTLAAAGKYIKAHKAVLSVCSPFFKDLFRANPSKHPIVILPEVNYNALCSLLQFMYQGEVSVSQEEIPMFMRVAELLQVKGLTDKSDNNSSPSSESNGCSSISKSPYNSDQKQSLKRMKPVKRQSGKIPSPVRGPENQAQMSIQPPAKKPHVEEASKKPSQFVKQEPPDSSDDGTNMDDHTNMDLSAMLDTKLGETQNWELGIENPRTQDSSTPGTLQCILGKRGNPRLIVDGYVFYKKSVYKGKAFWYCKNNRTPEKCPAVCWTMNGNIVKWPHTHTHAVIPDVFNPDEDSEVPIQNLQEVLWQTSLN